MSKSKDVIESHRKLMKDVKDLSFRLYATINFDIVAPNKYILRGININQTHVSVSKEPQVLFNNDDYKLAGSHKIPCDTNKLYHHQRPNRMVVPVIFYASVNDDGYCKRVRRLRMSTVTARIQAIWQHIKAKTCAGIEGVYGYLTLRMAQSVPRAAELPPAAVEVDKVIEPMSDSDAVQEPDAAPLKEAEGRDQWTASCCDTVEDEDQYQEQDYGAFSRAVRREREKRVPILVWTLSGGTKAH